MEDTEHRIRLVDGVVLVVKVADQTYHIRHYSETPGRLIIESVGDDLQELSVKVDNDNGALAYVWPAAMGELV